MSPTKRNTIMPQGPQRRGRNALCLTTATTLVASALAVSGSASATPPSTPNTPNTPGSQQVQRLASLPPQVAQRQARRSASEPLAPDATSGRRPAAVAATAGVPQLDEAAGDCPTGTTKARTLLTQGFENGLPAGDANPAGVNSWSILTPTPAAASGTKVLSSTLPATSEYAVWSPATIQTTWGQRTYLKFMVRGTFPAAAADFYANDLGWTVTPRSAGDEDTWKLVRQDLTDAVNLDPAAKLDLGFVNDPKYAASLSGNSVSSTVSIDDVEVYQCTSTASNTRGDFNGDGLADFISTDAAGNLWIWPGAGKGAMDVIPNGQPMRVLAGRGWEGFNWMASVGDFNGDGRADLWARDLQGNLWAYWGDGSRSFASTRTLIGTAWYDMVQIVLVGDMTGDGIPEMVGLDKAGNLWRYSVNGSAIRNKTLIGTAFYEFRNLLSTGDYNGDGTPDILGITKANVMYGYFTKAGSGTLSAHGTKLGEGWSMKGVSSPGDFDNNGFNDVLAVGPSNDLVLYFVKDGHWAGSKLVKSAFSFSLLG